MWNSASTEDSYIKIQAFLYDQNCRFVIHLRNLPTTKDPKVESRVTHGAMFLFHSDVLIFP